jgi:type I restriction enzyme S subunit
LKKSIIGSIPRQWDIVPLAKACLKIQDGTHFSPESKDGPYMYITSKNIRMGRIDLSDVALISEEEHRPIFQRADVRKGDVLLTKDGAQAGNIAINTIEEEFSLLSSVAMLRPDEAITSAEWIYQFYASERGQQLIQRHIAGQAIPRLTLEKINALPLALPTLHEQNKIAAVLSGLDSSLKRVEAHTLCLVNMKEGLMQTLLTGRIRVS